MMKVKKSKNMKFMACHAFFENNAKFLHYTNILQIMRNMQNIVKYANIVKIRKIWKSSEIHENNGQKLDFPEKNRKIIEISQSVFWPK